MAQVITRGIVKIKIDARKEIGNPQPSTKYDPFGIQFID